MLLDALRTVAAGLGDLVLPASCAGCGRDGATLCARCTPRGAAITVPGLRAVPVPVRAAGWYERSLRAAVLAYKERDRRDLTPALAALLRRAIDADDAVLVPIPSSRHSARVRGGDHVLRLARAVARGSPARVAPVLRLTRAVRDSAGLTVAARRSNLAGALVAAPPERAGEPVVVVDDIVTTGVTIAEAIRALRAAGWDVASAAAIAATQRRRTGTPLAGPG